MVEFCPECGAYWECEHRESREGLQEIAPRGRVLDTPYQRRNLERIAREQATKNGIDPDLFVAQVFAESGLG